MNKNFISVRGARVNNLKNIDVDIPRDKFVVVTGISGSGKSSLAFDTIFAEGQRRFVESLSSFARQFLGRMAKPDVDDITGIPPAIAIEQKVNTKNPRSTVGTNTEIYDYLRLLYARIGRTYSPISGEEVKRDTVNDVIAYIKKFQQGEPLYILTPIDWEDSDRRIERLLYFKEEGFSRLFGISAGVVRIDAILSGEYRSEGLLYLLVDRVTVNDNEEDIQRIMDSIQTAFSVRGISAAPDDHATKSGLAMQTLVITDGVAAGKFRLFSTLFERDGIIFEEPDESLFSFNNPLGACRICSGYGKVVGIDESLVVPDQGLSVYQEAIAAWRGDTMSKYYHKLVNMSYMFDFPIHKPYRELTDVQRKLLWSGNEFFTGIDDFFKIMDSKKGQIQYRYLISRYSGKTNCPECNGKRLKKEALYVKIGGKDISELLDMNISDLYDFIINIGLTEYEEGIAERPLKEIRNRLRCMVDVGLSYLTLNRPSNTLSGGESQRINLVSSLGSNLVGSLYILDEPSIGLHPRDTARLISVLKELKDLGNTLLIVEHDEEIMRSADQIIDIGPLAGSYGGELVFQGALDKEIDPLQYPDSFTLAYLYGENRIEVPEKRRSWCRSIELSGLSEHNLKNIDVKFPLGILTAVTGVSGSGKSTLVKDILYPALYRALNQFGAKPGRFGELKGDVQSIGAVEYIDQNPIGKSTRSNSVTYLKVYDDIRKLFSEQPYAKSNGYGHSHFSFNIEGGRCPECQGEGFINIEMQFMADVKMVCDSCSGRRFKDDILEVKYRGKNINDVLNMSVGEAISFFSAHKDPISQRVAEKLQPLEAVGLSYVQLGQSSSTLSGGESQRVKLAYFLSKESSNLPILFIFDEPTTGLHFHDIKKLLDSFNALIERGHTIVVVEHNMDIVKSADWVIDLGPEGGDEGGDLIFAGTPEELLRCKNSYTASAVKRHFE